MPNYIIAEPKTGRPKVRAVFEDYDVAKFACGADEIVTNANFVASKGRVMPERNGEIHYSRIKWPVTRPMFRAALKRLPRLF